LGLAYLGEARTALARQFGLHRATRLLQGGLRHADVQELRGMQMCGCADNDGLKGAGVCGPLEGP